MLPMQLAGRAQAGAHARALLSDVGLARAHAA